MDVAYCGPCGIWYLNKVPSSDDIASVYSRYWSDIRPCDLSKEQARNMLEQSERTIYEQRIFRIRALIGGLEDKTLLDVGCGLGFFLLLARKAGANVIGQDISQQAARFANEMLHLVVHIYPFADLPGVITPVDVVVMSDVLEHVADPLSYIRSARKLLNTGGLLVIHTPNGGQACSYHPDPSEWTGFKVDLEHLQYFSTKSMLKICGEGDWTIEHLETFGYPSYTSMLSDSEEPERACEERVQGLRAYLGTKKTYRCLRGLYSCVSRSDQQDTTQQASEWNQLLGSYHLLCILRTTK